MSAFYETKHQPCVIQIDGVKSTDRSRRLCPEEPLDFPSSTGFWMDNENCRAPDISFVRKERLRGLTRPPKRFFRGAPDLAVEILAPSHTEQDLKERLADYFGSGTQIAWVIDPESKTATVYHGPEIRRALGESDFLDGEHLLPGFRFAIAQLFADWNWE